MNLLQNKSVHFFHQNISITLQKEKFQHLFWKQAYIIIRDATFCNGFSFLMGIFIWLRKTYLDLFCCCCLLSQQNYILRLCASKNWKFLQFHLSWVKYVFQEFYPSWSPTDNGSRLRVGIDWGFAIPVVRTSKNKLRPSDCFVSSTWGDLMFCF